MQQIKTNFFNNNDNVIQKSKYPKYVMWEFNKTQVLVNDWVSTVNDCLSYDIKEGSQQIGFAFVFLSDFFSAILKYFINIQSCEFCLPETQLTR